jgi:hypothetical protein
MPGAFLLQPRSVPWCPHCRGEPWEDCIHGRHDSSSQVSVGTAQPHTAFPDHQQQAHRPSSCALPLSFWELETSPCFAQRHSPALEPEEPPFSFSATEEPRPCLHSMPKPGEHEASRRRGGKSGERESAARALFFFPPYLYTGKLRVKFSCTGGGAADFASQNFPRNGEPEFLT